LYVIDGILKSCAHCTLDGVSFNVRFSAEVPYADVWYWPIQVKLISDGAKVYIGP
jgi:hypothetical protein